MTIIIGEPPNISKVEDQQYFSITHRIGNTDYKNIDEAKRKARIVEDKYNTIYITKENNGKYRLYWI